MQRIVKRFLLHKQRENDEINEFDLDELKQDKSPDIIALELKLQATTKKYYKNTGGYQISHTFFP
jgi:hypothetical protein